MHISFSWWNTSLSPVGRDRATIEQKAFAFEVINNLISHAKIDCLALGEVTLEDIKWLMEKTELNGYNFCDGTLKVGRSQFDTGILYRKDTMCLIDCKSITVSRGSYTMKLANQIVFRVPETDRPFYIFVVHWPSRMWCQQNDADRHFLGIRLRDAVEELYESWGGPVHTIILGDFNDEPFDFSLSKQLFASRDRTLVRKEPKLLYNPFWRCLGETKPHTPNIPCRSYGGSYFYRSGKSTQWHTFDQIIFSSTFLGRSEWHLNENYTQILPLHPLDRAISKSNEIFDHFPIISVIEREDPND